jgi:nucleoid DNA-binding protein
MNKERLKERVLNEVERYKNDLLKYIDEVDTTEEEIEETIKLVTEGIINVYNEDSDTFLKGLIEFNINKKVVDLFYE